MHIVTCSNYFDSNSTSALRTGGLQKKEIDFCKFSHRVPCNLSILLAQNILVLDNSTKIVSCVRSLL